RAAELVGENGFRGVVCLPGAARMVMLVSAHPCGPQEQRGVLVMARRLDSERLAHLVSAGVLVVPREDMDRVVHENDDDRVTIYTGANGEIVSDTVLGDFVGRPTLVLRCVSRGLVSEQASMAVEHVGVSLLGAGLASTLLVYLLLGRLVLGRLERL